MSTLTMHARVESGAIVHFARKELGADHGSNSEGEMLWRPVVDTVAPAYDPRIQSRSARREIQVDRVQTVYTVADLPIDEVKEGFRGLIDAEAERRQLSLMQARVSPIKALVYFQRIREADLHAADPAPNAARYPALSALVGSSYGADLAAVAAAIAAEQEAAAAALAMIDAVAVSAKEAIDAAATGAAAATIYRDTPWP